MYTNETKKQHYIPQCILKNFGIPGSNQYLVWQHLKNNKIDDRQVPINKICCNDYLYEYFMDGTVVKDEAIFNKLEKSFMLLEGDFSKLFRDKINVSAMLNEDDILLCYIMIVVQLLRTPKGIKRAEEYFSNIYKDLEKDKLRNTTLFHSFITSRKEGSILYNWLEDLRKYGLSISYSEEEFILSNDNPSHGGKLVDFYDVGKHDYIFYFPISNHRCLMLYPVSNKDKIFKDRVCKYNMSRTVTRNINKSIYHSTETIIYSKHKLDIRRFE